MANAQPAIGPFFLNSFEGLPQIFSLASSLPNAKAECEEQTSLTLFANPRTNVEDLSLTHCLVFSIMARRGKELHVDLGYSERGREHYARPEHPPIRRGSVLCESLYIAQLLTRM
jgi:hypothetical protein